MASSMPRHYCESSVFVALLHREVRGDVPRWRYCYYLLREAADGKATIVTSALTIAEVTGGKGTRVVPDRVRNYFRRASFLDLVEADRRVGELARELIWAYPRLPPIDAVHLASALVGECEVLFTFDRAHLLGLDGQTFPSDDYRGMRPWRPLRIREPQWEERWEDISQLTLEMSTEGDEVALATLQTAVDEMTDEELDETIFPPDKPRTS